MIKKTHEFDLLFAAKLKESLCQIVVKMGPEVEVPDYLRDQKVVSFNLSWEFDAPMVIHRDGVSALLSFRGQEFSCWFPYEMIMGLIQKSTGDRWLFGTESGRRVEMLIEPGLEGFATVEGNEPDPSPPPGLRLVKE